MSFDEDDAEGEGEDEEDEEGGKVVDEELVGDIVKITNYVPLECDGRSSDTDKARKNPNEGRIVR